MSTIELTRKASRISTQNTSNSLDNAIIPDVTIVVTQSLASELDMNLYPQLSKEEDKLSKFCLVVRKLNTDKVSANDESSKCCEIGENCGFFRQVPMEESSHSFNGMDDLSDLSLLGSNSSDNDDALEITEYLKPCPLQQRSVIAINSAAHENNLFVSTNKIFINVEPLNANHILLREYRGYCFGDVCKQISIKKKIPTTWINKCRICYGTVSNESLLRPCQCKGSVAYAHLSCLEHWLRQSGRSYCELCKQEFIVLRQPKYGILKSIWIWLTSSGEHTPLLIEDLVSLALYTPATICSTYILILISENAARNTTANSGQIANFITFFAVAGIAAIDFTYSSWLMMSLQKHVTAWKSWYKENSCLTLVLPPQKQRRFSVNSTS